MNAAIIQIDKYDHQQHGLSDWLTELELRLQLGEVDTDKSKITLCQLLIGATWPNVLTGLEDDASWETAKETLLSRLGIGSIKDEAWVALKNYKKGSKEIVELAGEVEKLARRLHPHNEEAAERQAMDTFLDALERPPAIEVRKLGYHTMESVVTAARRIERILAEQTDPEKELQMQEQIRLLQEGLKNVRRQIAQPPAAPTDSSAAQPPPPTPTQPPPPLATPKRTAMRRTLLLVHRADHGPGHLHLASSVEKRGTSPPAAQPTQPSSNSCISPHRLGC